MRSIVKALPICLTALAFLGAGCQVDPSYNGHKVACSSDKDCSSLPGFTCSVDGYCVQPTSTGGDGGTTDGGSACNPACGTGQTCKGGSCVPSSDLVVTITSPADGAIVQGTVEVHATVTGYVGSVTDVTCQAGDAAAVAATQTSTDWACVVDVSGVAEGTPVAIKVTATDEVPRSASDSVTVKRDSTNPVVTIVKPDAADGYYVPSPGTLTIEAQAQDTNLAEIDLRVANPGGSTGSQVAKCAPTQKPTDTCTGTMDLSADPNVTPHGKYTIIAVATDLAGNTGRATLHFQIDDMPPAVEITSRPPDVVPRDQNAPFKVRATDAETTVQSVSFDVVDGKGTGQDLSVTGSLANAQGVRTFTVTKRGGAATPLLDATSKTYQLRISAKDAWGNQTTISGTLTITRVKWQANLSHQAATSVSATSPAVASDGTIYVAGVATNGASTIFSLAPADGTISQLGSANATVISGPVVYDDVNGVRHLYLLEQTSAAGQTNQIESFSPNGNGGWTYPPALAIPRPNPTTLPAVGTQGALYIGTKYTKPAALQPSGCVEKLSPTDGSRQDRGCADGLTWTRGGIAVVMQAQQDAIVVTDAGGSAAEVACTSSGCGLASSVDAATGQVPVGEPAANAKRFFITGAAVGTPGNASAAAIGYQWTSGFADTSPWDLPLTGPSTGVLVHGLIVSGGDANQAWWATTALASVNEFDPLPADGRVVGSSAAAGGRTFDLVDTTTAGYVVAFDSGTGRSVLWQFPDPGSGTALAEPAADTTPVLDSNGILYVPDSSGMVTALITDTVGPAAGWSNVRSDPARTSSIGG